MVANRFLGSLRGVSEDDLRTIDAIHDSLETKIKDFVLNQDFYTDNYCLDYIEKVEYLLQELWGFDKNPEFHTWNKRYLFKKHWVGTTWECVKTGEQFTIPYEVEECDFYQIGEGFVDVGRYDFYHRVSGVKEVGTPYAKFHGLEG